MNKVVSPESRWAWVEVNLAALRRNTTAFRRQLERGVQMNIMKEDPKMAGKSEEMLSKIIEGKISKHFKDQCLMDQEFFLNPDQKVSAFLKQSNASVSSFIRYAVGEGIEKKEENFVEEVMSQIKG